MLKHTDSHVDHGLTDLQLGYAIGCAQSAIRMDTYNAMGAVKIVTVELLEWMGTVPCALRGPLVGDDPILDSARVTFAKRGDRPYVSRLVDMPAKRTSMVTVIAGPHEGHELVLFTAFGGPRTPREPADVRREIEAVEAKRLGLSDLDPEHVRLTGRLVELRVQRGDADAFWAVHALTV